MRRPRIARERDHVLGLDRAPVAQLDPSGPDRQGAGGRDQVDAAARQQPGGELARAPAEQRQRRRLGGHDPDLRGCAASTQLRCAQQCQLVDGQWPRRAGRGDEGDAVWPALQQGADRLALLGAAEGQRAVQGVGRVSAGGEEQHVVGDLLAGSGHRDAGVRTDGGQCVMDDGDVLVGREGRQREAPARHAHEGLEDRERPVVEALGGGQQGDVQVHGAEPVAQGEAGLQCGDAASGDDDPRVVGGIHRPIVRRRAAPAIGGSVRDGCGFATVAPASGHGWRWASADLP